MDPVSHLIFGRLLAAVAPRPRVSRPGTTLRGRTAAIVIGSIAPDADCVLMPTGWDRYLIWHERGTHALLGTAMDGAVLAGLLWLALRGLDRHRGRPAASSPFFTLWRAAWLGALGHITLDLVSGGTIRLFAPIALQPFSWPLTAMADPLIALPLLAFLIASLIWKARARPLAIATLCLLAAVLGVKAVSERHARAIYARTVAAVEPGLGEARDATRPWDSRFWIGPRLELRAVEARWGSFTSWMFYDRTRKELRAWAIDARRGTTALVLRKRLDDATPLSAHDADIIAFSRRLDTVRHMFTLFDLTFVETRAREGGFVDVLWTDIRFCGPRDCALWFGGTFDADGNPREQIVLVGGFRQARPFVPEPLPF